jgi:anti-sigma-K factor RskA
MTDPLAPRDHEAIESLLGAFALDAVDPDEARMIEDHLPTCPRCRAEVDAHRGMAGALGNSVVALPAGLWNRIAEGIDQAPRRQVTPPPGLLDEPHLPPETAPGRFAAAPGEPQPRDRKWPGKQGRRWAVAALSAAAMVALIGFLTIGWVHANDQLVHTRTALAKASSNAQVEAALSTPGHRTVTLRSPAGNTVATVVVVPSGQGYFVSASMPALTRTQTYQLWAMFGDRAVSLGLMGNRPGHVVFTLASGTPTQLAVTVEPAGGVSRPDRLPVASGPLSA